MQNVKDKNKSKNQVAPLPGGCTTQVVNNNTLWSGSVPLCTNNITI